MTTELDQWQQTLEEHPALDETHPTVNDERVPSEAVIEPHEFTMISEIDPSLPEVEP